MQRVDSKMRSRITPYWAYVIILMNLIHIETSINLISNFNTELGSASFNMGIATLLAWFSLNQYLVFDKQYAYLPNTLIHSSKAVINGIIGIFPIFLGTAYISTAVMFTDFRFRKVQNAAFAQFYIMNGDTMFDTMTSLNQINPLFCILWSYLWIWFGINIVMNITLAMVEDGYLHQKNFERNEWMLKSTKDPYY